MKHYGAIVKREPAYGCPICGCGSNPTSYYDHSTNKIMISKLPKPIPAKMAISSSIASNDMYKTSAYAPYYGHFPLTASYNHLPAFGQVDSNYITDKMYDLSKLDLNGKNITYQPWPISKEIQLYKRIGKAIVNGSLWLFYSFMRLLEPSNPSIENMKPIEIKTEATEEIITKA